MEAQTQDKFWGCGLCFCNLLTEKNGLVVLSELLEPLLPVIFSSNQTTLVLTPFFHHT
jgi:hypothetical protein